MNSLNQHHPHILVVTGIPGSGKSQFATEFSKTFHAPCIDASLFGGSDMNTAEAVELAQHVLSEVAKTKKTAVYECLTGSRKERSDVARICRQFGYQPLVVWVQTDPGVAKARATKKSSAHQLTSEEFDKRLKHFTEPHASEATVVISGMHTFSSQAKTILKRLGAHNGREKSATPERSSASDARVHLSTQAGRRSVQIQ